MSWPAAASTSADGEVRPGDPVTVTLPDQPHRPLMTV
jgi:hypothetical protein